MNMPGCLTQGGVRQQKKKECDAQPAHTQAAGGKMAGQEDPVQREIHQDWANREYIEVITSSIKKIADFLNSFGGFVHRKTTTTTTFTPNSRLLWSAAMLTALACPR